MNLWEAIRIAAGALAANRMRSLLTVLGTVIAVLAVVSVVAITQGLNRYVAMEVLSTGSHVFSIDKYGFITSHEDWLTAMRRKDITLADASYLRDAMRNADVVDPQVIEMGDLSWRDLTAKDIVIAGMGENYPALGDFLTLHAGRHFTAEDVTAARRVAVLGSEVAEQLFGSSDPVGLRVRLRRESFDVIGVLAERGKVLGQSRDNVVVVPITTFENLFGGDRSVTINVHAARPDLYETAQDEAEMLLKIRRGLDPWDKPDFGIQTSESFYQMYKQITGLFYLGMIAVVGLSLVVGGVVMMNIMLVAVTERTREIGIRKAVGARRRDVAMQFLVEAAALAGAGGLIGVALGAIVAVAVNAATPLPARVEPWSVAASMLLAIGVGLTAGVYPAARAARLAPVDALRFAK